MDSQPNGDGDVQSTRRKGKCRATPEEMSEATPLLGAPQPPLQDIGRTNSSLRRRRRLYALLATVFCTTLGLCLIVILILLALTYTYQLKLSKSVRDEVFDRAVVIQGPDRLDVLNATEGSVWLQVDVKVGVDAGTALDVILAAENGGQSGFGARVVRRTMGRWFVRRMGTITVSAETISLFSVDRLIANLTLPSVSIPLTLDRPEDSSWLTHLSFPVLVDITDNGDDLAVIAQEAWRNGVLLAEATVHNVSVHGGKKDEGGWRRRLNIFEDVVFVSAHIDIPELPGLPLPGKGTPFPGLSDLITLKSFDISSVNHSISINATTSVIDPLPNSFNLRIPSIPFLVSFTDANKSVEEVTVTTGRTEPFTLTHPNITLCLTGTVPPLPRSSSPLLSSFLSSYLAGVDAPIVVGIPFLPSFKVPALFPAPHPRPQILRDVHIKNMRINFHGENVVTSGTIIAHVVLPPGINILVDAKKIWPDVLVFDGEIPSSDENGAVYLLDNDTFRRVHPVQPSRTSGHDGEEPVTVPKDPLPSPLPERAFARIRPEDWLPAHSEPFNGSKNAYEVTAQVVDVPLEVLPGRDHLLRSFISKVLFGGREGALAGVNGTAAVAVSVDGLPVKDEKGKKRGDHVFELTRLPFTGSVRVGRKGQ